MRTKSIILHLHVWTFAPDISLSRKIQFRTSAPENGLGLGVRVTVEGICPGQMSWMIFFVGVGIRGQMYMGEIFSLLSFYDVR